MKRVSEDDVRIGQRIRAARLAVSMSQEDLGDYLGVSYQQIQKYELGKNRVAGTRLVSIGSLFGVSVGHLLGEDSHHPVHDDVLTALASPGGHALSEIFNRLTADRRKLLVDVARAMVIHP